MRAQHSGDRVRALVGVVVSIGVLLAVGACSSGGGDDDGASAGPTTGSTARTATKTEVTPPPLVHGGMECGTLEMRTGWPTTTVTSPAAFDCIIHELEAGHSARMVVVSPGKASSGSTVPGGYDLPVRHLLTWIVLGPGRLQQTTDLREDGGRLTTVVCSGLSIGPIGQLPVATGC